MWWRDLFFPERREGIVALEIGTTKVAAAAGEIYKDGRFALHHCVRVPSSQIRKAEIMDLEAARHCVQQALVQLEKHVGLSVQKVYLVLSGAHTRSVNHKFTVQIENDESIVTDEEVKELERLAQNYSIPKGHVLLETIHQRYTLDDGHLVVRPTGLVAQEISADYHLVYGLEARWSAVVFCVKQLQVEVEECILSSYATAQGLLGLEDKKRGAVLINMGGGLTEYIVYHQSVVVHSGVLGVGGENVTQDISLGLNLPFLEAENLKIQAGALIVKPGQEEETVVLPRTVTSKERSIRREALIMIMHARVEETLQIVQADLAAQPFWPKFSGKIFMTGGASRVSGLREVAQAIFSDHEVSIGEVTGLEGSIDVVRNPELATVIGLLRFARKVEQERPRPTLFVRLQMMYQDMLLRLGLD